MLEVQFLRGVRFRRGALGGLERWNECLGCNVVREEFGVDEVEDGGHERAEEGSGGVDGGTIDVGGEVEEREGV